MKQLTTFLLFVVLLSLSGCSAYKSINMMNVSVGMTKQEVVSALKKKPDNLIGSKQYSDGVLEVLQYSRYEVMYSQLEERYWLYFFNNKLIQWGRPGDWEREADQIYEIRNR